MKNKLAFAITSSALLGSLLMSGTAFAEGLQGGNPHSLLNFKFQGFHGENEVENGAPAPLGMMLVRGATGVAGSVTAVGSTTLTVSGRSLAEDSSASTFTVDATNASIVKNGTSTPLSQVSVGDNVLVLGTVNGTSVTATSIRDGIMNFAGVGIGRRGEGRHSTSTMPMPKPPVTLPPGNGQPVVGGTVTSVGSSTIAIGNKAGATFTIDASHATIVTKGNASSTLSQVSVGDEVLVQGAVNGSSITAATIFDQAAPKNPSNATSTTMHGEGHGNPFPGIIHGLGNVFRSLFGFF